MLLQEVGNSTFAISACPTLLHYDVWSCLRLNVNVYPFLAHGSQFLLSVILHTLLLQAVRAVRERHACSHSNSRLCSEAYRKTIQPFLQLLYLLLELADQQVSTPTCLFYFLPELVIY